MAMDFSQLTYDTGHALRRLIGTPTFTLTVVAVLALGIAASVSCAQSLR